MSFQPLQRLWKAISFCDICSAITQDYEHQRLYTLRSSTDGGAGGVAEEVEVGLQVEVAVGVVGAEALAG